ncbi:MAG: DUF1653 domain-containing protein [Candidatus Paracaedibacteraceae bacterium]|nr:DUF1653 domain-containing protein [Candidatus Paracaedibacteraceae bacterium]
MIKLGLYQHYKGNLYQVIGMSRHSETLEIHVVYQALYGDYGLWVRPFEMFEEFVTHNGKAMPRFKFLDKSLASAPLVATKV